MRNSSFSTSLQHLSCSCFHWYYSGLRLPVRYLTSFFFFCHTISIRIIYGTYRFSPVDAASLCNMNSSTTPQQSTKSCHNDKLTYSLLLCQQHRPAGLGSFDAQSLSLLPIFLRLTFPIALAGSRSLPAVWLIPYRMGFPPIKCFTLSWTH